METLTTGEKNFFRQKVTKVTNRVSDSITIIGSSIIDYFRKNVRIFRLIRLLHKTS